MMKYAYNCERIIINSLRAYHYVEQNAVLLLRSDNSSRTVIYAKGYYLERVNEACSGDSSLSQRKQVTLI